MSERYTYLCYIGLFLLWANHLMICGIRVIQNSPNTNIFFALTLLVYGGYLGYKTIVRNKVWNK